MAEQGPASQTWAKEGNAGEWKKGHVPSEEYRNAAGIGSGKPKN